MKINHSLLYLLLCAVLFIAAACTDDSNGGNTDADADTDADSDADTDADTDTDTDADSDADTDDDIDADSDSDADCNPDMNDFSFFVVSLDAVLTMSGSQDGFGGDLGGRTNADAMCQQLANEKGSCRQWRAFLSVTESTDGTSENAIERIGEGPWYGLDCPDNYGSGNVGTVSAPVVNADVCDFLLMSEDIAGLQNTRPDGSDQVVWSYNFGDWTFSNCLTTENGVCNHAEGDLDTHDTITGSDRDGNLISTDPGKTCNDWTSSSFSLTDIDIGHTWPRNNQTNDDGAANWIQAHSIGSCGAGINTTEEHGLPGIGGEGGYGAWYCFAHDSVK